jgi:glyoxylase-like metal-dependent hydrolase (beta-lactamase superfamily II)
MGVKIPYRRQIDFEYGKVARLSPLIRRVIAKNPSPFTFHGTGTYIVGNGDVAIVDPGPVDSAHIAAVLDAVQGERISHVLVTHTHMDHSPGCRLLAEHCDAPRYGYGPHGAGKIEVGVKVEEGGDMDFTPDVTLRNGAIVQGGDWSMEAVYTPGHTSNHLCFQLREEKALFTGDHVMGWSTSIISPPDGDMQNYMASLDLLLQRDDRVYWPTHGPSVVDPKAHVRAFIEHRHEREQQILVCIDKGILKIRDMVPPMYADVPEFMYPAAARSVFAAVVYMVTRGELVADGPLAIDTPYRRA